MAEENARSEQKDNRPENVINVSIQKNPNFYVFLGKKYLQEHDVIELHALGNATSTCVIAAENLQRNGYAEFVNIRTDYIELKSKQRDGKLNKKAKLFITLKKAADFDQKMEEFNAIKEKRQAEQEERKKAQEHKAEEKEEEQKEEKKEEAK